MPKTIGAGEKTLDHLLFLAEQGIATERQIADTLDNGSEIQARRYLATLASRGFAKKTDGRWMLDLKAYHLPFAFAGSILKRLDFAKADMLTLVKNIFGEFPGEKK